MIDFDDLNPLLRRYVKRLGISNDQNPTPQQWSDLLRKVSDVYDETLRNDELNDRAFGLASAEMQELYRNLEQRIAERTAALETQSALLSESEQRYRMLAENASDVVWQFDANGVIEWVSPSVQDVLGWTSAELVGKPMASIVDPIDLDVTTTWQNRVTSGIAVPTLESRVLTKDGSYRSMSLHGREILDSDLPAWVVGARDIQQEVNGRRELAHTIEHDSLTGLVTMPVAITRIERLLAEIEGQGPNAAVGVLCIGMDSLKAVNEGLTHTAGDMVLVSIAARIASVVDHPDLLARGSGDEFLFLAPNLTSGADAGVVAEKILEAVQGRLTIGESDVEPTVSIGVATGGSSALAAELVRDASIALHQAKENGRNRAEFLEERFALEAQQRLSIEKSIRNGLENSEFVPWLQPIVNVADATVVGYEALVRWIRPDGTIVPPMEFLPVAEQSHLIANIDSAVLMRSIDILATLPEPMHIAVNVSAATLASTEYAQLVIDAMREAKIRPARLHVEYTETALLSVSDHVRHVMTELAEFGVRWYVDDFGTGFSSLSHLRDLPVAGIKLDLSFTAGIRQRDQRSQRLAAAVAGLAKGLGLDSVAEGIETPQEAAILAAQGWNHFQGWLFGRPEPITAIHL